MPTAAVTFLPPPLTSSLEDEPRSLDALGVETVLGAMIEQRRASEPTLESAVVPSDPDEPVELSPDDLEEDYPCDYDLRRVSATSEIFLKVR